MPPGSRRDAPPNCTRPRWAAAGWLLLLAAGCPVGSDAAAPSPSATGRETATIVRVRQIEPRRVIRCTPPVPAIPVAPRPAVGPEVAAAGAAAGAAAAMGSRSAASDAANAARGATGGTSATARPAGPDPRAVAAATAAAILAADAIQQPPPTIAAGGRDCAPTLEPPVIRWRVEYFLAGRYHRAWFAASPPPDLSLAELLRATDAGPR